MAKKELEALHTRHHSDGADIHSLASGILLGGLGIVALVSQPGISSYLMGGFSLTTSVFLMSNYFSGFSRELWATYDGVTKRPSLVDRMRNTAIQTSPPPYRKGRIYFHNDVHISDLRFNDKVYIDLLVQDTKVTAHEEPRFWTDLNKFKEDPLYIVGRATDTHELDLVMYGYAFCTLKNESP